MNPQIVTPLVMAPLIAFAVWRRIRTQFGRQPIRRKAMMVRIGIFSAIGALFAFSVIHDVALLQGLIGGLVVGAALGLLGLRLTRFDTDALKGDCYLPNPWIGGILTVLLLVRLAMAIRGGSARSRAGHSGSACTARTESTDAIDVRLVDRLLRVLFPGPAYPSSAMASAVAGGDLVAARLIQSAS